MALIPRIRDVTAHMAEGDAEDLDRVFSAARKASNEDP